MSEKRELVQVNIRLFKDNVEEAKRIAERDKRPYHAIIRDAVDDMLREKRKQVH